MKKQGDEFQKKMEDVLSIVASEDFKKESAVCTGWMLVSEWADFKGEKFVISEMSENLSPWAATGILYYVIENQIYDTEQEDED